MFSKPTCDSVAPLRGILKAGTARDDHQKVVCFSGPAAEEHREVKTKRVTYPPGQQPHFNDDPDFCAQYEDPVSAND